MYTVYVHEVGVYVCATKYVIMWCPLLNGMEFFCTDTKHDQFLWNTSHVFKAAGQADSIFVITVSFIPANLQKRLGLIITHTYTVHYVFSYMQIVQHVEKLNLLFRSPLG
jgi:hypothetical protein